MELVLVGSLQFGSTDFFCFFRIKCVLYFCVCRSSSKPEKRSLAPMSKRLSPSWETAAQRTWGKVCLLVSELQRRQNHSEFDVTDSNCVDLFQYLMHTWRWLGMRWRRALREKHLEVWRTFFWPWVRADSCVLMGRSLIVLYNNFYIIDFSLFHFKVKCARSVPAYFAETLYKAMKVTDFVEQLLFLLQQCGVLLLIQLIILLLIKCVKSTWCRVQELMTTPWSEWWWAAVRWTCWTSELHSERCLPVLFIAWSR